MSALLSMSLDRRARPAPRHFELATDAIRDRTSLVRNGSPAHEALKCLGWETLSVEGDNALVIDRGGITTMRARS